MNSLISTNLLTRNAFGYNLLALLAIVFSHQERILDSTKTLNHYLAPELPLVPPALAVAPAVVVFFFPLCATPPLTLRAAFSTFLAFLAACSAACSALSSEISLAARDRMTARRGRPMVAVPDAAVSSGMTMPMEH